MVKQASLFSQLLCLVDRHRFEREVRRFEADAFQPKVCKNEYKGRVAQIVTLIMLL